MKRLVLFSLICITTSVLFAQKEKAEAYINQYKELAIAEMLRTGVPASIKLAQGILESQSGESDLAKTSNNHFGIKCKTEWTGARTYHDDDEKGECFRVYASVEESYRDHSDFLKNRPYYTDLFKLDPTDDEAWAKGLKKAGYATSPTYPQQLLKVINDYNLQQYSLEALSRKKNNTAYTPTSPQVLQQAAPDSKAITSIVNNNTIPEQKKETEPKSEAPVFSKSSSFPQGIFTINHSKVIFVNGGTSLLAIAGQYDIPLNKLFDFNELPEMDILDADRLIFIEKKLKKGASDFHLVASGETLYDISQLEGIRLESLLEYNNLTRGASIVPGEKIYLRSGTANSGSQTRSSQ